MQQQTQELHKKTLDLLMAKGGDANAQAVSLIRVWLASIEDEDLAGLAPESLSSVLYEGFFQIADRSQAGCKITSMSYPDGRGGFASALLIVNDDMPYLVDSIVMALRKKRVAASAILNAVLSVERDAAGRLLHADSPMAKTGALESVVLCLLSEQLSEQDLAALIESIQMVVDDAAVVNRDAAALAEKLSGIADAVRNGGAEEQEVAAFLAWARSEGFEPFGYAYYQVTQGVRELTRDMSSRIGVLQSLTHPVYGNCLAGIPGDFETLSGRADILSVVKADAHSTLHRDQRLDFIGVRDTDASGTILGEHCFVGLFTRAATTTALSRLPYTRGKVAKVLDLGGVRTEGFRAEKFLEILESLPRTEVMEAEPQWLADACGAVVSLYKQPRTKVFARRDVYGRHVNVLVYLPRQRYNDNMVEALAQTLRTSSGASDVRSHTLVADGPLARLYLIATAARNSLDLDVEIQQPLIAVLDGWHQVFSRLVDGVQDEFTRMHLRKLCSGLPADYIAATSPHVALRDLCDLLWHPEGARIKVRVEIDTQGLATIRLYSVNNVPSLSRILPALHNAGVLIDSEQTHSILVHDGTRSFVTCLIADVESSAKLAQPQVARAAEELFEALFNDEAEDGRLNGLVIDAGLRVTEVQLLRGYISYWRQAGSRFSVRYVADCLRKQPIYVRALIDAFHLRFNPEMNQDQHDEGAAALTQLKTRLIEINHVDTEKIFRIAADLMLATLRTTYFSHTIHGVKNDQPVVFKFDSSQLTLLPEPRPYREIFVFSRRFEGVHLRGGPVARGGLRWSDRMEDYRTEVLGLVKAQMVKNAVIVPVGAKGGFVCRMMPKDATREVIAAEGEAVYRLYIGALLDITDNRVRGEIVRPSQMVCFDEPDPYLVVAADKGTATFSDIANGIALERGFWLGDAFASGGSNGYDHKKLGITAKGAWEAVKRHFYEMDHDLNSVPITMVGIGDMSGDVFGNGLLLSHQVKLVAAFDHRHIFIDPTPDVTISFDERARLFKLPRSSWDDYDEKLISKGGGVWPRTARSIELSPEAREVLGISSSSVTPEELMHSILLAPVDLFYNGGIGTYIKASSESDAQVKDRANDNIRVDGSQLRCKVVTEGGNLGVTQAGRIEFALKGGHIFTDAIDNSAGVDCSDHEVNVKIWLDVEVNAGALNPPERNRLLTEMTSDIVALVLRDNTLQTHLLAREAQAQKIGDVQDGYAALIASLDAEGFLSRELEQLPTTIELARRKVEGHGLAAPELALVIAHGKNRLKRILGAQPMTEKSWAQIIIQPYFPPALVATRNGLDHPLSNAILATVLANEVVNRCGPLLIGELARTHQVEETDVICAWAQGWSAFNLAPLFATLDTYALAVPRAVSVALDQRTRVLQKAMIDGVLSVPPLMWQQADTLDELTQLFGQPSMLKELNPSADLLARDSALPPEFVQASRTVDAIESVMTFLFTAMSVPRPSNMSLAQLLKLGMALRLQTGIDDLESDLQLAAQSKAQEQLRDYAQQALRRAQQKLLLQVLKNIPPPGVKAMIGAHAVESVVGALEYRRSASHASKHKHADLESTMLDVWALCEAASLVAERS